jgi:hypothetical protein
MLPFPHAAAQTGTAMNPEEFHAKYPLILKWMRQTLAAHAAKAQPVASLGFARLPRYFTPTTLATAKVVAVAVVPLPPLTALGLSGFADFEQMDASGITYLNTFFVQADLQKDERVHFHELVHVVQWALLGPERFLAMYADGLERFGYRNSPLEAMAYRLDSRFHRGGAPFSVEQVVGEELKLLGGG